MDLDVEPMRGPFDGALRVPPSKSIWQRLLVLAALAEGETVIDAAGEGAIANDVAHLATATQAFGRWHDGALGGGRDRMRLDLGLGATGFRFALALAALRPPGARTLVTGRPGLLARPHAPLLRALERLGVGVKRRRSGAVRIIATRPLKDRVDVDVRASSQFASALMLIAPRMGGLALRFPFPPVSRGYLGVTAEALAAFGIRVHMPSSLDAPRSTLRIPGGAPRGTRVPVAPDASAAAAWWAAAALTGSRVTVPGLSRQSSQADLALVTLLEQMGARIEDTTDGFRVSGPAQARSGRALAAPGPVDLRDAPDLLPIVAVLAAWADGETVIRGVAHARGKESDRLATTAAGLKCLGGDVEILADGLRVRPRPLHGGTVAVAGDHRIGFAFGVLGLVVPGVRLRGAPAAVAKSDPGFLDRLRGFAHGGGN